MILPFPTDMAHAINPWPALAQTRLHAIRDTILDAAKNTAASPLVETLKWGEPSWLPKKARVGSTLRVSWKQARPDHIGLFVNCRTTLAADIREIYPDQFEYEGNRALWLTLGGEIDTESLGHTALMVLLYHRRP